MADEKDTVKKDIIITIEDGVMKCSIPLSTEETDEVKSKITAYGSLKVAEEQMSIFYMQRAMRRQQLLRGNGPIIPGRA